MQALHGDSTVSENNDKNWNMFSTDEFFFKKDGFISKAGLEREKEILHLLVHSLDDCDGRD